MGGPAWERRGDAIGKMEPMETLWTRMSYRSPELSKTALFFLRIHPSEAACERSLSPHGPLCWERGARLLDESIRALMFVRSIVSLLVRCVLHVLARARPHARVAASLLILAPGAPVKLAEWIVFPCLAHT